MGNAWTRLVQEASKHGGPLAMRQHYANLGANATQGAGMKGFVIGVSTVAVSIGASWLATKAVDRAAGKKMAADAGAPTHTRDHRETGSAADPA